MIQSLRNGEKFNSSFGLLMILIGVLFLILNIYDIQQNLSSPEYSKYAEQLVQSELLNYRNVSGESVMAYHLLFNDVLKNTIQLHELNYNLIR